MAQDAGREQPDADLLAQYAAGEPHASRVLAARHLPRVLRLATRLLADRSEAEDVAQETMLRLWRAAPGWRHGEAQVSTWLYRVAVNLCTDRIRRRRTVPIDGIDEPDDGRPSVAAELVAKDRMAALDAALSQLPDRQREAVVLRHIEGLSNPEIADVMEIGVEAVESLTARGKRSLAAILAGRRDELGYAE